MVFAFFTPGPMEICICIAVLLLLFGPKQIPAIARGCGSFLPQFKAGMKDVEREIAETEQAVAEAVNGAKEAVNGASTSKETSVKV